jgi:hypothetical protein
MKIGMPEECRDDERRIEASCDTVKRRETMPLERVALPGNVAATSGTQQLGRRDGHGARPAARRRSGTTVREAVAAQELFRASHSSMPEGGQIDA